MQDIGGCFLFLKYSTYFAAFTEIINHSFTVINLCDNTGIPSEIQLSIHSFLYIFICYCVPGSVLDAGYERVNGKHIISAFKRLSLVRHTFPQIRKIQGYEGSDPGMCDERWWPKDQIFFSSPENSSSMIHNYSSLIRIHRDQIACPTFVSPS